jgi:hypothetical protein
VLDALAAACRRGARVMVRLDGDAASTNGALGTHNTALAAWLTHLGADAKVVPGVHLKAAIVGDTLFLDDRNWAARSEATMLRDGDAVDVDAVRSALDGAAAQSTAQLSLTKTDALHQECGVLEQAFAGDCVDVESESFGKGSGVYGELRRLAQSSTHCRLLVSRKEERTNGKEDAALRTLEADGVEVRIGTVEEKFALAGSARAWLGSANATTTYYDGSQLDWGAQTTDPAVVTALQDRFTNQWSHAKPFLPAYQESGSSIRCASSRCAHTRSRSSRVSG